MATTNCDTFSQAWSDAYQFPIPCFKEIATEPISDHSAEREGLALPWGHDVPLVILLKTDYLSPNWNDSAAGQDPAIYVVFSYKQPLC